MPVFDTPKPISVTVELGVGDIQIAASDRVDTVVEVRPSDPAKKADVAAAARVHVEYANGTLLVRVPKGWRQHTYRGGDSIDVQIEMPTGSHVRAGAGLASLRCTGRLGECHFKTGLGDVHIESASRVELKTGIGDVGVDSADGDADVRTGSGGVRIGSVRGAAVIRNSNGDTSIDDVSGDLRVSSANGKIVVDRAGATVAVKTANGDVRLGEVARGAIVAQTARGMVDIGILDGVAAWLDLNTSFGTVHNQLDAAQAPAAGDAAVEVRGRTGYGDITIHRSLARSIASPV